MLFLLACIPAPDDTAKDPVDTADTADTGVAAGLLSMGFEQPYATGQACTDTYAFLYEEGGASALEMFLPDIVARAQAADGPVQESFAATEVRLAAVVAEPLTVNYCTDAMSQRMVFATYTATAGTVSSITSASPTTATLSLSFSDVEFVDEQGHTVGIDGWSAPELSVMMAWGG